MMFLRNPEVLHDTEDRGWWHLHGQELEKRFVGLCKTKLNLDIRINPEKSHDVYAPDLLVNGAIADLKTQNTPFFTASQYGIEPRYAVTFNRKDYERYKTLYPEIVIYFWLDWMQTSSKWGSVEYFGGVFCLPFKELAELIARGAPEHFYIRRQYPGDQNAKSSFVLDVRNFQSLFTAESREL